MRKTIILAVLIATPAMCFALDKPTGSTSMSGERATTGSTAVSTNASKIFEQCDLNNDGKISRDEFNREKSNEFARYDTNSDGMLTKEEHQKLAVDTHDKLMGERTVS